MVVRQVVRDTKKSGESEYVKTFVAWLNPKDNGGESVCLEVDVFKNGDGQLWTNFRIESQCYGVNSTQMNFYSVPFNNLAEACNEIKLAMDDLQQAASVVSAKAHL